MRAQRHLRGFAGFCKASCAKFLASWSWCSGFPGRWRARQRWFFEYAPPRELLKRSLLQKLTAPNRFRVSTCRYGSGQTARCQLFWRWRNLKPGAVKKSNQTCRLPNRIEKQYRCWQQPPVTPCKSPSPASSVLHKNRFYQSAKAF